MTNKVLDGLADIMSACCCVVPLVTQEQPVQSSFVVVNFSRQLILLILTGVQLPLHVYW